MERGKNVQPFFSPRQQGWGGGGLVWPGGEGGGGGGRCLGVRGHPGHAPLSRHSSWKLTGGGGAYWSRPDLIRGPYIL